MPKGKKNVKGVVPKRVFGDPIVGIWHCYPCSVFNIFPRILRDKQEEFRWKVDPSNPEREIALCPKCSKPLQYDEEA